MCLETALVYSGQALLYRLLAIVIPADYMARYFGIFMWLAMLWTAYFGFSLNAGASSVFCLLSFLLLIFSPLSLFPPARCVIMFAWLL